MLMAWFKDTGELCYFFSSKQSLYFLFFAAGKYSASLYQDCKEQLFQYIQTKGA